MSYFRRGKWYWADFSVNGTRYRVPLDTTDWREAARKESEKKAEAQAGRLAGGRTASLARLNFEEAMSRYLAERKIEIRRPEFYRFISKPLCAYFKGRRLNQVTTDDVKAYRVARIEAGRQPKTVNHEVGLLLRLLKRAKLRHLIGDEVKPLPVVTKRHEMLTLADKQRLFEIAASREDWQTAYCAALLTANTTLRPVELKRLKWEDLEPVNRELTVWRSKTEAGSRTVPLNDEAWAAIAALKARADKDGIYAPEHFIFPRQWPKVDPKQPMGGTGWRKAWRNLTRAVECPKCKRLQSPAAECRAEKCKTDLSGIKSQFAGLRFYDLRHQAITEMLEGGVPEGVIREIAGHVDPAMTRHYSHPRRAARRAAVEALQTVKSGDFQGGYVTNGVTKQLPAADQSSQPADNNGRGAQI